MSYQDKSCLVFSLCSLSFLPLTQDLVTLPQAMEAPFFLLAAATKPILASGLASAPPWVSRPMRGRTPSRARPQLRAHRASGRAYLQSLQPSPVQPLLPTQVYLIYNCYVLRVSAFGRLLLSYLGFRTF